MDARKVRHGLAAAQARIVEQNTELIDKNKSIEILQARVDSLEDVENSRLYDKYFMPSSVPHQKTDGHCLTHYP